MPLQAPGDTTEDEFVTAEQVAPFVPDAIEWVIDRVNALVAEKWANPVDPIPVAIRNVAFDVAVRALGNPKGTESRTRSTDGTSVTDRYTTPNDAERRIYLTSAELRILQGSTRRRRYGTVMVGVR